MYLIRVFLITMRFFPYRVNLTDSWNLTFVFIMSLMIADNFRCYKLNMARRHIYNKIFGQGVSLYRTGTKLGHIKTILNSLRYGTHICQARTMYSEWIYSRKNVKIAAPVFLKAYNYPERVAVIDSQGAHTYGDILYQAHMLSTELLQVWAVYCYCMCSRGFKRKRIAHYPENNAFWYRKKYQLINRMWGATVNPRLIFGCCSLGRFF